MIFMDNDGRVWATYSRTNKRVQWRYSQWSGRWSSVEEAEGKIKERYPAGAKVQYRSENLDTGEVVIGEVTVA